KPGGKCTRLVAVPVIAHEMIGTKTLLAKQRNSPLGKDSVFGSAVVEDLNAKPVAWPVKRGHRMQQATYDTERFVVDWQLYQHAGQLVAGSGCSLSDFQFSPRPFDQIENRQQEKSETDENYAKKCGHSHGIDGSHQHRISRHSAGSRGIRPGFGENWTACERGFRRTR